MAPEDFLSLGLDKWAELTGTDRSRRAYEHFVEFDEGFADYIAESSFGRVWGRPGLPIASRSLVTIAALIALGRPDELKAHFFAGLNVGLSPDELKEVIIHMAPYCGIPASIDAVRVFREVMSARERAASDES